MAHAADMAKKNTPLEQEELEDLLREVAIRLGIVSKKTKEPYDEYSDVSSLAKGFLARCEREGIYFMRRGGSRLAQQRWFNASQTVLATYRDKVIMPALEHFQGLHITRYFGDQETPT